MSEPEKCLGCWADTDGTDHDAQCPVERIADMLDEFRGIENTRANDFIWATTIWAAFCNGPLPENQVHQAHLRALRSFQRSLDEYAEVYGALAHGLPPEYGVPWTACTLPACPQSEACCHQERCYATGLPHPNP